MSEKILTPDQRIRVFISSRIPEFVAERRCLVRLIRQMGLIPVFFEEIPRPHPPRDLYRAYLEQSDIFLGIYGTGYGWIDTAGDARSTALPLFVNDDFFAHADRRTNVDIDVLVQTKGFVRPDEFRNFALQYCPALDLFVVSGNRAVSCANESHVEAATVEELIKRIEAVEFWNRQSGVLEAAGIDWQVVIQRGMKFPLTMARGMAFAAWEPAVAELLAALERDGIPVKPFIGSTIHEWAQFLPDLIGRMVQTAAEKKFRGKSISTTLADEYDFQDLFWLVTKPWLPGLAREPFVVNFDGQEKKADFAIAKSRIVIELKCIKDANTKAAVVKTLSGLQNFYQLNANVRLLVFAILALPGVEVDANQWEADFSSEHQDVIVRTLVVKVGA